MTFSLCLSLLVQKTSSVGFLTIFPTFDHLADLYPDLKIIYTDKLLEIAGKSSPPSAKWFLSLPGRLLAPKDWGIYVVVLQKGSSRPLYSPCRRLDYATSKRGDIRREINWKQRRGENREEERRPRYVFSNIYMDTSYHSDTPRHKSVVADNCGLFCRPYGYQAKDRNILHRHQGSGRHKRTVQKNVSGN